MMSKYCFEKGLSVDIVTRFISEEFTPSWLLSDCNKVVYANKLSNNACFLICYIDNNPIGFIAYYENITNFCIYISLIAINKDYRNMGIGGELLRNLETNYLSTSYKCIELEVYKDNVNAFNFYIKHGFTVIKDVNSKFLMHKTIRTQ